MSPDDITKFSKSLQEEAKTVKSQAMEHAWSMRGGCQYETILMMSPNERKMIAKITKDNLEVAKKSGMPYF